VDAPLAVNVPLPQKIPLFEGVIATVGFELTVALTDEEVTDKPEVAHVITHL
jgi:hypothetical protein